jgi:hypothetical protein
VAATVASIQIAIEAQTAQLRKGFQDSKQAVDNLGKSMSGRVAAGMAKFHLAVAGVRAVLATLRGAINAVSNAMAELDEEAKVASRLDMAADQVKILGFAAEQTGASAGVMNASLERMTRRIGQAAKGSGEAQKALADLGLSAERMLSMSADQQFAAIADAMGGVGTHTEKAQLAMDIFGRQGIKLLNVMAEGSEGLNKYGKELEDMGVLLGDNREQVEGANDAINRMKKAWGAIVQRVAIAVAPALEAIADILSKIVGAFNHLFGAATGTTGSLESFAGAAAKAAGSMKPVNDELEKAGEKTVTNAEKAREIIAKVKADFEDTVKSVMGIGAVTRGTTAGFSAVREAQRAVHDAARRDKRRNELLERIETALKREGLRIEGVDLGI